MYITIIYKSSRKHEDDISVWCSRAGGRRRRGPADIADRVGAGGGRRRRARGVLRIYLLVQQFPSNPRFHRVCHASWRRYGPHPLRSRPIVLSLACRLNGWSVKRPLSPSEATPHHSRLSVVTSGAVRGSRYTIAMGEEARNGSRPPRIRLTRRSWRRPGRPSSGHGGCAHPGGVRCVSGSRRSEDRPPAGVAGVTRRWLHRLSGHAGTGRSAGSGYCDELDHACRDRPGGHAGRHLRRG